jgi:3-phenylpropionate/trans-cinnamate dioxygenase ferredoxin reductase component
MVGKKVTMVFLEEAINGLVFPSDLAQHLTDHYREKGVEVITNESVASVQHENGRLAARTGSGRFIETDGIVAGIGIRPNVGLAEEAGIKVENGIVVNERLETSAPGVYAAGDAANFLHSAFNERTRVEHEDNAVSMGKLAGGTWRARTRRMTTSRCSIQTCSSSGTRLSGETSSKMETVSDWDEQFEKGVIYYLKEGARARRGAVERVETGGQRPRI